MPRTRLLLAAAVAVAVFPAPSHAGDACAGVDVIVPGPVIGWGTCVATPLPRQVCRHPFVSNGPYGVVAEVCVPTP